MPTIPRLKDTKHVDRQKPIIQSSNYYNKKGWKLLRNSYIRLHPLCERCLESGITTAAEEVHHKIPFMTGMTEEQRIGLLLDPNNLMSVCRDCHLKIHFPQLIKNQ